MFAIALFLTLFSQGKFALLNSPDLGEAVDGIVNCVLGNPNQNNNIDKISFLLSYRINETDIQNENLTFRNETQLQEAFSGEILTYVHVFFHDVANHGQENWITSSSRKIILFGNIHTTVTISVDYKSLVENKTQAVTNIESIANRVSDLLIWVKKTISSPRTSFAFAGHGFGAIIAARVSEIVMQFNSSFKPYNFVALDPELFNSTDSILALLKICKKGTQIPQVNKSHADGVYVVHTSTCSQSPVTEACNNNTLNATMGHIDYFLNGGFYQPGCAENDWVCNRNRAAEVFAEALVPNIFGRNFRCCLCESYERFVNNQCAGQCRDLYFMDFFFNDNQHGRYYLKTNPSSPFAIWL